MNLKQNLRESNKFLLIIFLAISLPFTYYSFNKSLVFISPANQQVDVDVVKAKINNTEFKVQIADNELERSVGLMNIKYLEQDKGMLFIFPEEAVRTFWMKNTFIPLDMIFINKDYKIIKIYENTKPLDTSILYSSQLPAQYVLEINAGLSATNLFKEGDIVTITK